MGIGIYFAVNASYSKISYSYKNDDGTKSIFYVRVAVAAETILPPGSYRLPPEKPKTSNSVFSVQRYDSIKGNTAGSDIFIIYENSRAYPDYLITFKN